MNVLQQATDALRELEEELAQHKLYAGGEAALRIADRIREVRKLLSQDEAQWIGTTEAKRLLGVDEEQAVEDWAGMGLLRSRTLPNGRLQVLLDDVLREREVREGLTAIDGGEEISHAEMMHLLRPRLYPRPAQPVEREASSAP